MGFDAGAIIGRMILDKNKWDSTVRAVGIDQQKMKNSFSSFATSFKANWIAVTAAITGSMLLINKSWQLMQMGAKAQQIEDSFAAIARQAGISGAELKKALNDASIGMANFSNVAASASALLGQSLKPEQIVALMQVARVEAKKTGQDVEAVFNQIASAVTGGFLVTVKRNFGLNVELANAYRNYAQQLGITTTEVEQYYKAQALANEIIKAAKVDIDSLSGAMLSHAERIQQLKASWNDFQEKLGYFLLEIMTVIGDIAGIAFSYILSIIEMILSGVAKIMSIIPGMKSQMNAVADEWYNKSKANTEAMLGYYTDLTNGLKSLFSGTQNSGTQMFQNLATQGQQSARYIKQTWDEWIKDTQQNFNLMLSLGQGSFNTLKTGISDLGMSIIGMGDEIEQVFANLGKSIINMLMEIAAQWIAMKIMMGITSVFSFGTASAGTSSISASDISGTGLLGHSEGIEDVPYTGVYRLHEGEKVTPKYDATKGEAIELTIVNQITPEAVATAMSGKEGQGVIVNTINTDALRNGTTRKTIRRR
jgi:hypothetical protein